MILNALILALRQIQRNFLRAFLTMLGVIIGVGAVVVMISLGNSTTQMIEKRISSLGSNLLLVFPARIMNPSGANLRRNFSLQETQKLQRLVQPYIQALAPIAYSSAVLQFQSQNTTTQAQGINEAFFEVTQWDTSAGRVFDESHYRVGSNVCVIGETVRKNLFKDKNPLGQKIRLNNIVCECIGVLDSKGQGGMGNDQDDVILLPLKTFSRSVSKNNTLLSINRLMIALKNNVSSEEVIPTLTDSLRLVRNVRQGEKDSFEIMDTKQIAQTLTSTTKMLTALLGLIAGISLIVGGIGIMNIMLVSVTERTKEIGTRMAIGALQSEVLMQFLIESMTLSSLGGLLGIIWAFFASFALSLYMNLPFIFDLSTAIAAFLFSMFIGVLFGYIPAKRASKLNPIDALRHE